MKKCDSQTTGLARGPELVERMKVVTREASKNQQQCPQLLSHGRISIQTLFLPKKEEKRTYSWLLCAVELSPGSSRLLISFSFSLSWWKGPLCARSCRIKRNFRFVSEYKKRNKL